MRNHGGIGPTLSLHSILRHPQGYPVAHPWFGDDVLGSAAASSSLRRSRFTTCRTSQPSNPLEPHTLVQHPGRGHRAAHEYRRAGLMPIAAPLQRLQEPPGFRRPWNLGLDLLYPQPCYHPLLPVSRKLPTP